MIAPNNFFQIDKLVWILFFVLLNFISNASFGSFPHTNDTLNTGNLIQDKESSDKNEDMTEYHERLLSQGFDLSNCACSSCTKKNSSSFWGSKTYFGPTFGELSVLGIVLLILTSIVIFLVLRAIYLYIISIDTSSGYFSL